MFDKTPITFSPLRTVTHARTHAQGAECVFLFVMLSSAAARADGGGLCMALPGELSHKKTHILQGILHDGGGELAPLRHAEPDISLGIHFATAVKHTHTPLELYVPLRLIRYTLFSASVIHTAGLGYTGWGASRLQSVSPAFR